MMYLGITSGVMLNIHYCMGEKDSMGYGIDESDHCGKCGMNDKNSCCHSEYKLLKVQDAHVFSAAVRHDAAPALATEPKPFTFADLTYHSRVTDTCQYHSPPDPRVNQLRFYQRVFRI